MEKSKFRMLFKGCFLMRRNTFTTSVGFKHIIANLPCRKNKCLRWFANIKHSRMVTETLTTLVVRIRQLVQKTLRSCTTTFRKTEVAWMVTGCRIATTLHVHEKALCQVSTAFAQSWQHLVDESKRRLVLFGPV